MNEHIVKSYEEELLSLDRRIAHMGGLVENIVGSGFDALERRDPRLAEQAIAADKAVDAMHLEIEQAIIGIIARRQPMADDLRHVMAALRIASELERIGDLGKNIAKRALTIAGETYPRPLVSGLRHMLDLAQRQLKDVLDAYATRDADAAMRVRNSDADIDATYNSVFRELLTYMMEDPRNISLCTHLLFGAKNIERIGDHTTNIAETIHYLVKGEQVAEDRPKSDRTSSTLITR
jgi:phosphate transport system protein